MGIRALEKAKATGNYVNTTAILDADSLVSGEDLELDGINGSEIVYDDTSSDASDSTNGLNGISGSVVKTVSPGNVMAVSLPTVPGVTVSLPTLSSTHQLVTLPNLNTIQPGVTPGQQHSCATRPVSFTIRAHEEEDEVLVEKVVRFAITKFSKLSSCRQFKPV